MSDVILTSTDGAEITVPRNDALASRVLGDVLAEALDSKIPIAAVDDAEALRVLRDVLVHGGSASAARRFVDGLFAEDDPERMAAIMDLSQYLDVTIVSQEIARAVAHRMLAGDAGEILVLDDAPLSESAVRESRQQTAWMLDV